MGCEWKAGWHETDPAEESGRCDQDCEDAKGKHK